jgi:hypothetical protein
MVKKYVTHGKTLLAVEIALVGLVLWMVLSSGVTTQPGSTVQASNQKIKHKHSQERWVPQEGVADPNAARLVALAATPNACQVFDFAGGSLQGFIAQGATPPASPLWHLTNGFCGASNLGHSTPFDFYYGQDATCNYNTGARNASNLLSPSISLAGIFPPYAINFNYLLFVEGGGFDTTFVDISTNGGTTWTQIISKADMINNNQWHNVVKDVTANVGAATSIRLRFRFDSIDNIANSTTGWHVDDITVCGQAFNFCLQSDSGDNILQFNSITGAYSFIQCSSGFTQTGTGTVTTNGSTVTLIDNATDHFVSASVNTSTHTGSASVQKKTGNTLKAFNIKDSDTTNNTCACAP